jgi:DNA-binding NarL/FixJ family response regulator
MGGGNVTARVGVKVAVHAEDLLDAAGLHEYVSQCPDLTLAQDDPQVRIVVIDSDGALRQLQGYAGQDVPLIVIGDLPQSALFCALDAGVMALVPAGAATWEHLTRTIEAVLAGGTVLPPRMVTGLVRHLRRLQADVLTPNGLSTSGLTTREVDVLRMLADGFDTAEIARELNYGARTVKNLISRTATSLNLRNRTHVVSHAVRNGLI